MKSAIDPMRERSSDQWLIAPSPQFTAWIRWSTFQLTTITREA
jgi:hypothetical protein